MIRMSHLFAFILSLAAVITLLAILGGMFLGAPHKTLRRLEWLMILLLTTLTVHAIHYRL